MHEASLTQSLFLSWRRRARGGPWRPARRARGGGARPSTAALPRAMEELDVEALAAWLTKTVRLPQLVQSFCDNEVDGATLLDLIENGSLGALVESIIHQSRVRGAAKRFEKAARRSRRSESEMFEDDAAARPCRRRRLDAAAGSGGTGLPAPTLAVAPASAVEGEGADATPADKPTARIAVTSAAQGLLVYAFPPPEGLQCALCLERVVDDPHQLRAAAGCTHAFCRTCLLGALGTDPGDYQQHCLQCCWYYFYS